MLILKSASKSRPSGEWDANDFDVFDGERRVGRIFDRAAHVGDQISRWFWGIDFHELQGRIQQYGAAATREDAMAKFKAAWDTGPMHKKA